MNDTGTISDFNVWAIAAHPFVTLFVLYTYPLFFRAVWIKTYLYPYMIEQGTKHRYAWTLLTLFISALPFYVFIEPKIENATIIDFYSGRFGIHPLKKKVQSIWFWTLIIVGLSYYLWRLLLAP